MLREMIHMIWSFCPSRFLLMGGGGERNGQKEEEKSQTGNLTQNPLPPHPNVRSNWSKGLRTDMKKPELVVFSTPSVVVIKDKFPKAKYHFLVLPRWDSWKLSNFDRINFIREELDNLQSLGPQHVSLLEQMQEVGKQIAARWSIFNYNFAFTFQSKARRQSV